MIRSMTGFATMNGAAAPHSWSWELRAVNGKNLDVRVRVPDWIPGLEVALRKMVGASVARGNVTLGLRILREETGGTLTVNDAQLTSVLDAMAVIENAAMSAGVSLAPSKASDIVAMRGVLEQAVPEDDNAALAKTLLNEFPAVLEAFNAMRSSEGAALHAVVDAQLNEIDALTTQAAELAIARQEQAAQTLRRNLARVLETVEAVDAGRLEQELALIAVKSDVTEEIDRLRAHVAATRDLLGEAGPVGRKLDFMMQEFNREANTLCSKAQNAELTRVGLALKAVIDQLREQIQNVE